MTAAVAAAARDWNERARGQLRAVRCFPMETESLWLVFFFFLVPLMRSLCDGQHHLFTWTGQCSRPRRAY